MFKLFFRRDLSKRAQLEQDMRKNQKRAQDEIDAIDSIMKRVDEIRAELEAERTLNK